MPELRLERLVHVYPGGVRAVDGVDLVIGSGERVAIVGQNGSGKTTLVRHLNGLLRPTEGRVLVDGRDAARMTVARLAGIVGLAFQDPDQQIFSGTVRAEVAFGPRNLGLHGQELSAAVAGALATVGLAGDAERNPYDLGAARRKLLSLASVLAMETPVLVLDEPTTGQDPAGRRVVAAAIAGAAARGATVVAISHDMDFVAETFERIVVMRAGRVLLDGEPAAVFGSGSWEALRSTYLEPPLAAVIGASLDLGSTPTDAALLAALAGTGEGSG